MGNGRPRVKNLKSRVERVAADNFYAQVCPSRRQEVADSRMVSEDKRAIANLSQQAINRTFMANRFMESLGKFDERSDV